MLEGTLNELRRAQVSENDLHVVWVPGAFEIPVASDALARSKKVDALVAIGCIIRGETSHYEHIAQSTIDALERVALEHRIPVGLAVITVENLAQAMDRSGGKHGNKGRDAAKSALEMIHVLRSIHPISNKEKTFKRLIEHEFKK